MRRRDGSRKGAETRRKKMKKETPGKFPLTKRKMAQCQWTPAKGGFFCKN